MILGRVSTQSPTLQSTDQLYAYRAQLDIRLQKTKGLVLVKLFQIEQLIGWIGWRDGWETRKFAGEDSNDFLSYAKGIVDSLFERYMSCSHQFGFLWCFSPSKLCIPANALAGERHCNCVARFRTLSNQEEPSSGGNLSSWRSFHCLHPTENLGVEARDSTVCLRNPKNHLWGHHRVSKVV